MDHKNVNMYALNFKTFAPNSIILLYVLLIVMTVFLYRRKLKDNRKRYTSLHYPWAIVPGISTEIRL